MTYKPWSSRSSPIIILYRNNLLVFIIIILSFVIIHFLIFRFTCGLYNTSIILSKTDNDNYLESLNPFTIIILLK